MYMYTMYTKAVTHGSRSWAEVTERAPKKQTLEDLLRDSFSTEPERSKRSQQIEGEKL